MRKGGLKVGSNNSGGGDGDGDGAAGGAGDWELNDAAQAASTSEYKLGDATLEQALAELADLAEEASTPAKK